MRESVVGVMARFWSRIHEDPEIAGAGIVFVGILVGVVGGLLSTGWVYNVVVLVGFLVVLVGLGVARWGLRRRFRDGDQDGAANVAGDGE